MRDWKLSEKASLLLSNNIYLIILLFASLSLPFILPYPSLATEILIFAIAAVAFDILIGYTGQLTFCQGAFFGAGAYATGLILIDICSNIWLGLFMGIVIGGAIALIIGFLSIQRSETYSVLITYALGEVVYFISFHWRSLTGGDNGLTGIERPNLDFGIFSVNIQSALSFYYFVMVLFIITFIIMRKIINSPFGRVLKGIRENEVRTRAIGFNIKEFKLVAFIISGVFSGLAGGLSALYLEFAHISNVSFHTSGIIVMMALVGGMGTLYGPVLGAGLVTVASDLLSAFWPRWLLILGAIFITFVLFMRGGIWGFLTNIMKNFSKKIQKKGGKLRKYERKNKRKSD